MGCTRTLISEGFHKLDGFNFNMWLTHCKPGHVDGAQYIVTTPKTRVRRSDLKRSTICSVEDTVIESLCEMTLGQLRMCIQTIAVLRSFSDDERISRHQSRNMVLTILRGQGRTHVAGNPAVATVWFSFEADIKILRSYCRSHVQ